MIRRLLLLNGLATLGVVLNHATAWGFIAMFWWTHQYLPVASPNFAAMGSPSYYALRIMEQLIIFTIPSFLFVSGFFVSVATGRHQATISRNVVGVRIAYVLIPYLLWSVVLFTSELLQGTTRSIGDYPVRLLTGGATSAFYFVPLLCQLYLLAPFLVPLARNRWKVLLAVAALVQFTAQLFVYTDMLGAQWPFRDSLALVTASWLFPRNLFWFAFGMVVGFHLPSFKLFFARMRWTFLVAAVVLFIVGIFEWEGVLRLSGQEWLNPIETIVDNLYAAFFILAFLAFDKVAVPYAHELGFLGSKSFGVYLVHSIVLELTARTIYHTMPGLLAYQVLFLPLLVVVGLGVPLALMALATFNRSPARGYYQYIFG